MITFANGARLAPRENTAGGSFDVEASMIGLPPGEWPPEIEVTLDARGMEPEMPLDLLRETDERLDGEIAVVHYATPLGSYALSVWND